MKSALNGVVGSGQNMLAVAAAVLVAVLPPLLAFGVAVPAAAASRAESGAAAQKAVHVRVDFTIVIPPLLSLVARRGHQSGALVAPVEVTEQPGRNAAGWFTSANCGTEVTARLRHDPSEGSTHPQVEVAYGIAVP